MEWKLTDIFKNIEEYENMKKRINKRVRRNRKI